ATREEIATAVCERIADSALYGVAWIAERDDTGGLTVRTAAGVETTEVGTVVADGGLADPGQRALETGELWVFDEVPAAIRPVEPGAHDERARPMAVVPLSYRDVVYGVLGISATRPDAFSERERAGL